MVVAEGALYWCPSGPATELDKHHLGNMSLDLIDRDRCLGAFLFGLRGMSSSDDRWAEMIIANVQVDTSHTQDCLCMTGLYVIVWTNILSFSTASPLLTLPLAWTEEIASPQTEYYKHRQKDG